MRFKMESFPLHLVTTVGIGELGDERAWISSKRVESEPVTCNEKCLQLFVSYRKDLNTVNWVNSQLACPYQR
jgi:hypothetical protein